MKDEGIFVSNEFLSRLESSLIKFQVLLDYLEQERKQPGADDSRSKVSKLSESNGHLRHDSKHDPPLRRSHTSESLRREDVSKNPKQQSASNALHSTRSDSRSVTEISKSVHSASRSVNTASVNAGESELPSEKYSESFASSKTADTETEASAREGGPSTSSPSRTSSGHSTIKPTSTSRKSVSKLETRDDTAQDADATITSDNSMDGFGLNIASIEGISKRSSYMKIANEIYEDPHILESTRASAVLNEESEFFSSRRSSSSSRRTDTNIEQLEERLKVIQNKYNEVEGPLRKLGTAFEATRAKDGDRGSEENASPSAPKPLKPMKLDDVSISESWIADAIGDLNDRSLNSIPSSFSGDLTGSDLEGS